MSILDRIFSPIAISQPPLPERYYLHLTSQPQQESTPTMEGMARIFQVYKFFSQQKSVDVTKALIEISENFYKHLRHEIIDNTPDLTLLSQRMKSEDLTHHLYLSAEETLHYLKNYTEKLSIDRMKAATTLTIIDQELGNFLGLENLDELLESIRE